MHVDAGTWAGVQLWLWWLPGGGTGCLQIMQAHNLGDHVYLFPLGGIYNIITRGDSRLYVYTIYV